MIQGENAPPMHVRCRSTIAASLGESLGRSKRVARDSNGRNIRVPADMRYADWKKVYIDKTLTLKDWQKNKLLKSDITSGYGVREDAVARVLEKDRRRKLIKAMKIPPDSQKSFVEQDFLKQFKVYDIENLTFEQKIARVDPNFSTGKYEWTHNCQRCVAALELLQRGYNVTSRCYDANDLIGSNGVKLWKINGANLLEDPDVRWDFSKFELKKALEEAFEEWGENARVIIRVKWLEEKVGHFFTAQKINGKITYVDSQSNRIVDIDDVLKKSTLVKGQNWFMRVDNREFTEYVSEAVQNWEE